MVYIGLGLLISGFSLASIFIYLQEKPSIGMDISLFLAGLGHGIMMPVMMREAIALIDREKAGQASGLISISIQIGSVTGGTIIGTVFFSTIETLGFPKAFALAILMIAIFQVAGIFINKKLLKHKILC